MMNFGLLILNEVIGGKFLYYITILAKPLPALLLSYLLKYVSPVLISDSYLLFALGDMLLQIEHEYSNIAGICVFGTAFTIMSTLFGGSTDNILFAIIYMIIYISANIIVDPVNRFPKIYVVPIIIYISSLSLFVTTFCMESFVMGIISILFVVGDLCAAAGMFSKSEEKYVFQYVGLILYWGALWSFYKQLTT